MPDVPEHIGVLVVRLDETELLKQEGCLYRIVSPVDAEETKDMDAVSFYNWIIQNLTASAVVFLGHGYDFTRSDSLNRMVSCLSADDIYGACYSDNLLYNDMGDIPMSINRYFSTFGVNDQIINTAVCVRGSLLGEVRFNENVKLIHLWDLLLRVSQKALIRHIPEILFTSRLIMQKIDGDLEEIGK